MVVNYSKWDALELSDDSDIEVHPNVDKRSFIRAKQNQIHMERENRKRQIKTLQYERQINTGLLDRIDALLAQLRSQAAQVAAMQPNEFLMRAMVKVTLPTAQDKTPDPPADIQYQQQPRYSEMIASLVDQAREKIDLSSDKWFEEYCMEVTGHRNKVASLQAELETKLAELEREESSKITSDSIHDGFSTSIISQETPQKETSVELLNPGAVDGTASSKDEKVVDADDDVEASELGKQFAQIGIGRYSESLQFIKEHRLLVNEREQDGLLVEAFNAQLEKQDKYSKQCVHQALLLQYCRSLGKDGVGLFFKR